MKKYGFMCCVLLTFVSVSAQYAHFPTQGTISYEKTVFIKNLLKRYATYAKDEQTKKSFLEMADRAPENQILRKSMVFSRDEMNYAHVKQEYPDVVNQLMRIGIFESGITSYQNLTSNQFKSKFELGDETIAISDSLLHVKWKITNEYREIAGYSCRRANGVVLDSIYVVAFYTDVIPVSGGPAAFSGLPGMILGIAIPELHYNIFATQVDLRTLTPVNADLSTKKLKSMPRKEVYDRIYPLLSGYLGDKIFNLVMAGYYL